MCSAARPGEGEDPLLRSLISAFTSHSRSYLPGELRTFTHEWPRHPVRFMTRARLLILNHGSPS